MKVLAPGKLILSGEHSVVHGKSALAMAVNRYVTVTTTKQFLPFVSFDLFDFSYRDRLSIVALKKLKSRIKEKYQRFVRGDFHIRDVLQKPAELAQFAMMVFFEMLNVKIRQGVKISLRSDIPVGCGMGSSAATILGVVHALANHFQRDVNDEMMYRMALEAENMQHGYSSGLDLRVSLQGGCIFLEDGKIQPRSLPQQPIILINTGIPRSSTGECVSEVKKYFSHSSLAEEFDQVTHAVDHALQTGSHPELIKAVRENHRLLKDIQVVPERVENFISEIEATGGAAKICGAGSIAGDHAGMVWVILNDTTQLTKCCAKYHYEMMPVAGESRGVHVI